MYLNNLVKYQFQTLGIIQRQSIKFTVVNLVGTFIGFLSVVFVYSLDRELYGIFQSLHSFASLLVPFLGLGIHGAIIKFNPVFAVKQRQENFLSFTLVVATVSSVLALGIIGLLYHWLSPILFQIFDNFSFVDQNKTNIIFLGLILLYSSIFLQHAAARYRIVIPDLINNIGLKLFLPVIILLIYFGYISKNSYVDFILTYFIGVAVFLFIYLLSLGNYTFKPHFQTLSRPEYYGFSSYMLFSVLNGLGASLALKIDAVMISAMINLEAVTIYGIVMTISNVMDIPNKAINQIAGPVIANSWNNGDTGNIQEIYRKSSIYGFIAGLFLFLILYFIWKDILQLMPNQLNTSIQSVLTIFCFLGAARIIDLITGVNSVIISYSTHYRYHMYFLVLLGLMNFILNYFLIMKFGLEGAAAATFLSYLIFNALKHIFVKFTFGLSLEYKPLLKIVTAFILVFGIMLFFEISFHPVVNIILKSSLSALLFLSFIWVANPGGDIRSIVKGSIHNFRR